MDFDCGFNFYWSILTIVPVNIQFKCIRDTTCIYNRFHSFRAIIELRKDCIIYIIVYQNNSSFGRADKLVDKHMSIEYLTIKENTFFRRKRSSEEKIDFPRQFFYLAVMFRQATVNPILHVQQPLIYTITTQKIIF